MSMHVAQRKATDSDGFGIPGHSFEHIIYYDMISYDINIISDNTIIKYDTV